MKGSQPRAHAATASSTLPLFPLLASHNPQTRTDAATQLITALPLSLSDPKQDPDTPYTLKRLVTGLASSNEAARQGFAVALAQLVQSLPEDNDAATVFPALIEATTSKAGMDAREERDLLFARLMGLHALVRSGVLVRPEGKASNAGENWKEVVLALVSLANKKTWIREPAYWVVCDALRALLEVDDAVAWKAETVQWAVQRLLGDAREKARGWSPEKVAIVLVLQSHGVDADYATLLAPTFPSGSLLARSSLSTLANALKGSLSSSISSDSPAGPSQGSNAVKTAKSTSAPAPGQAPHFVWQLLCDAYFPSSPFPSSRTEIADRAPFNAFWTACIDTPLFGSSSHPLKALGFNLIQLFLPRLSNPAAEIQTLFGPNALRVLHNHLKRDSAPASAAGGGKTLAKVAEKLVGSTLPSYLSQHPEAALPVLKALVSEPNSQYNAFETKVLEKIVVKLPLSAGGVRGWVAYLRSVVLSPSLLGSEEGAEAKEDEEKVVAAQRNWAFDQMLFVVRNASVEKDDELVKGLLEFLAVVGWFEVRKEGGKGARSYTPTRPLTPTHRLSARSRFFSILSALVSAPAQLGGPAWLARALGVLDTLEGDSKHFARAEAEDEEEEKEGWERLKALHASLSQSPKNGEEKELLRRATARALLEGVRLVVWDEGADEAGDVIEGAVDAVEALFPSLATSSSSSSDDEYTEEGDKPEPATILLDTLLTLLRRPSAFVKSFVGPIVLRGFADEVGEQGVELVLGVVAPEEEEEEEGEDEEMDEGEKEAGDEEDEEQSSEDEDDEDDEDDGLEVDEAFKQELLAALEAGGMAVPNAASDDEDEEMQDGEGESEEEELLDDDAMLELDERLADIFRANGGGRRSKKRDRQDDLHYRLRCLDLLDVLAHAKPASPLLTPLFVPLFNLIRTASSAVESELQTKAGKLLRFLVQPRRAASPADSVNASASAQTALDALKALHKAAANVDDVSLAPLCAQVGVALVKTVAALTPSTAQADVSRIYLASFEKYLTTKNAKTRVQPALTLEAAKRAPAALWGMVGRVVELAAGEGEKVNAFRRMQAFEVAQALVTAYANLKTAESKAGVLAALPPYRDALYTALSSSLSASTASPDFDIARLKLLAKQALAIARLTVQISSQSTAAQLWKADEWAKLIDVAKKNERFKGAVGVQTLVKQLVGVLGASVAENAAAGKAGKKEKKRKAGAADKANEGTPAKKAKQDKAAVPAPLAAAPENEVQDESVEAAEGAEADTATPSKKDKKKKRRQSAGKA
ncbi:rDNA transcriptional regulator POL5 [Rhodotorula toruloides]|uniref:BY PROTMAP: gi/472587693/gb/EMS25189.1/ DNA polymerase phi subunit [Rhodosporidium toruloides NP11] gi/647398750/emb/CDR42965.1/ RHTO0S07e05952g1_1 [Rhodosporidium toruloides] n=1 Tax=Rhodotorula toruloides TaxID=5286 RepID=A0A0K3CL55_RHOTO|nr:rDNA transcriptional regulator POL5 [Rhodotorula toruloides]PRQ73726.1 DNA polymerase phi-domain containing protein [Rhodotorula toruloides]